MADQWLELKDGSETRRIPLAGALTKIGGASPDVSMEGLPAGELHIWSDPPKVVLVAGGVGLSVNGSEAREALLADGDQVRWGGFRFLFRREVAAPVLEEIDVQAVPEPARPAPVGGGAAWERVRAGMIVELGLADKALVRTWQDSVIRGDFAPDACAGDLSRGIDVDHDDPRLIERSGRLLRDFLMASTMSGAGGARRKVRQAGKKGAAIIVSQLFVLLVYTLIILVVMALLHAKWPETFFDPLFDKLFQGS
ncbi:MAG: hypothetical protein MK297_02185 [Planctomycetes bacterium]|nr:hypothetical protein [Planctomycetota bacterium]